MTRPDDSSLDPADLRAVEKQAYRLLNRADAWNRFPVPIDDILSAAEVRLAPTNAFNPATILSYLTDKAAYTDTRIKSAITKVRALYDSAEAVIHIDCTVGKTKQTFLKLHEIGHHNMPTHRKMYRIFQDCEETLSPDIADHFEREANNFARCLLFKGDTFATHAADHPFEIKTPMTLARKFGASIYAAVREYARTSPGACVVFVLDPLENSGLRAPVRRVEPSATYVARFGIPTVNSITPNHFLWPVLPVGCRMTRPVSLTVPDLNGQLHECIAEAFDTTYNILILLYTVTSLTTTTILMPASANCIASNQFTPIPFNSKQG